MSSKNDNKNPRCLQEGDFYSQRKKNYSRHYIEEWKGVAESMGYETITDLLVSLYFDESMSLIDISNKTGFSVGAIKNKYSSMRLPLRPPGLSSGIKPFVEPLTAWSIRFLRRKGHSFGDIGRMTKVDPMTAKYWAVLGWKRGKRRTKQLRKLNL